MRSAAPLSRQQPSPPSTVLVPCRRPHRRTPTSPPPQRKEESRTSGHPQSRCHEDHRRGHRLGEGDRDTGGQTHRPDQTRSKTNTWETVKRAKTNSSGKLSTSFTTYKSGDWKVRAVVAETKRARRPSSVEVAQASYPAFGDPGGSSTPSSLGSLTVKRRPPPLASSASASARTA